MLLRELVRECESAWVRDCMSVRVRECVRGNVSACVGDKLIRIDVESVVLSLRASASVGA